MKKILEVAIVFLFGRFVPKDRNLILVASGFDNYSDNAKYFFEYATNRNKNGLRFIFVTRNKSVLKSLIATGKSCVYRGSTQAIFLALRAKVFIITHNIKDIIYLKPNGCKVINIWHGSPIKKIGFDSRVEKKWIDKLQSRGQALPYHLWDFFIAENEVFKKIFQNAMSISSEKICVLGQPKNDFLSNSTERDRKNLRNLLGFRANDILILYAPTFRIKTHSQSLTEIASLIEYFQVSAPDNYKMLIRLHPKDGGRLDPSMFSDSIINAAEFEDIQELLLISDALISDYSSLIWDFQITQRPICLFLYDYVEFCEENGGLYFDLKSEFDFGVNSNSVLSKIYSLINNEYPKEVKVKNLQENQYSSSIYNLIESII